MSSFFEDNNIEKGKHVVREYWWIGLIALGVFLIGLLIWALTATDAVPASVQNKYWKRTTDVQEYRWVIEDQQSTFSYPSAPVGSRNVSRSHWEETISYPAKYKTVTIYSGSGANRTSSSHEELVRAAYNTYEDHYKITYEIQRWVFMLTLALEGNNNQPVWPEYDWDATHRAGQRSQNYIYTFILDNKDKETKTFNNSDEVLYGNVSQEDSFILSINKFGAVLKVKQVNSGDIVNFEGR